MCLKMFRKVSSVIHNSYSVTKVLHKHLKVLVIFCRSTNSVTTPGLILRNRNSSTEIGVQTDIKQNTATGSEHLVTNEVTSSVHSNIKTSKKKYSKDVLEYLNSKDYLKPVLCSFPEKLLKRRKVAPDALYTIDRDVAKNLVDQIAQDIVKGEAPVFEVNPGLGFISRGLLAAGIQRLWLCESAVSFAQQMKELQNEFPERVKVLNKDLFMLAKLAFQDNMDGGSRVQSLFHGVPKAEWEDDPVMKIIGVLPSLSFIKHVIQSHVFQTGIIVYGRPEFYFIMSPAQYFYLTCHPGDGYFYYRSTSILFQLIFEWNLLEKLPRTGFLPWEAKRSIKKWSKLVKVQTIDPDFMYLVKIVPRRDFFRTVVSADQLQPLWFFVRYHLRSRKNRVIPHLEKWIPGCGPRIIMDGMTIFTEFGDLTPQEILSVFQKFVSWPEYPECPFLASMETTFMKMESATYNIEKDSDDEIEEGDEQS